MNFLAPDHPFVVAVRDVNLPKIKELVAQDGSLVNAQVRGDISLRLAAGREPSVINRKKATASSGLRVVDVNENDPEHVSAIHFAAFHGLTELTQLLIDLGADLNATSYFGKKVATPVTLAAWEGSTETLRIILEAMSDQASASGESLSAKQLQPALFTALVHRSHEKAELLIQHGAKFDIFTAAMAGEAELLKKLITAEPESIDQKHPEYERTPLEQALKVGQIEMANLLADHGATVTLPSAAAMGRVDIVKDAIESDKEAITRLHSSYPLLIWAIHGGQVEVAQLLLEQGADPNGGDRWDYSPLSHVANVQGEVGAALVDLLIGAGADPHAKSGGKTPIQWALENKNRVVHHRLACHIENDVNVSDEDSKFWKAVSEGDLPTVKACLSADPSLASKRFPTSNELFFLSDGLPLFVAAANGHWDIAKLLVKNGSDPDAKRDLAESRMLGLGDEHREIGKPVLFAYAQGNFEMVNYLLDQGASVHAHGYCDIPFATQVHQDATAAGAPSSMVLRSIPNLDAADLEKIAPLPDDVPEVIKLYNRILSLGAIPNHYSIAEVGDYETIKLLLEKHPDGVSHDHWGGTVHEALLYGSAWRGFDKVVEMCMDICADRHTTYAAQHCIFNAIKSHNRPGSFESYYRIIELNLDYLANHNAFDTHDEFIPLQMLTNNFLKKKVWGGELPTVDQQLQLAQLCLDKGINVNHTSPTCPSTALDLAIQNNHPQYQHLLRTHGGNTSSEIGQ